MAELNEGDQIQTEDNDTVEVDSVQVGGKITDEQGHEWAIPLDSTADLGDLGAKDVAHLIVERVQKDGNFCCRIVRFEELDAYKAADWVPVTKSEVGLELIGKLGDEYNHALGSYCTAENCVFIKKPKVLVEREHRAEALAARQVVESVEPTQEMLDRAKDSGFHADYQRTRRFT